jgi:RND superfamily putative drug exporter
VLIDATVVRLILVPAVMELLGRANWWLPSRLAKVMKDPAGREPVAEPLVETGNHA